jgi:hypothetical protein
MAEDVSVKVRLIDILVLDTSRVAGFYRLLIRAEIFREKLRYLAALDGYTFKSA